MKNQPTAVSKELAAAISAEIAEAVKAVIKKHGLAYESSKSSYGDFYEYKIRAAAVQMKNGINTQTKEARQFVLQAPYYGFTDETAEAALGSSIIVEKLGECRLYGCSPRKRTRPLILMRVADGKTYECSISYLRFIEGFDPSKAWDEDAKKLVPAKTRKVGA